MRDERRLAAGGVLNERLREALRESRWLLVILTPASCRSQWVDSEISYWCTELDRASTMILLRGDETVNLAWSSQSGSFVAGAELPPALVIATHQLPLYVEFTGDSAASDEEAAIRVAASVLNRAPEDVAGEELKLRRRRRRLATAAVAGLLVLTIVSVITGALAVQSSRSAQRNERRAVADALANRAIVEETARPDKALALGVAARRLVPGSEGRNVLMRLLLRYDVSDRFLRLPTDSGPVAVSPSGRLLALADETGAVRIVASDASDVPETPGIALNSPIEGIAFVDETRLVAGLHDGRVVELSARRGALTRTAELTLPSVEAWAFHRPTRRIAVGGYEEGDDGVGAAHVSLLRSTPGSLSVVARTTEFLSTGFDVSVAALGFDRPGRRLVVSHLRTAELLRVPALSPAPGSKQLIDVSFMEGESVAFRPDGAVVIGGNPGPTADRTGVISVFAAAGSRPLGDARLEQSVNVLATCRDEVFFGTRSGETGRVLDDNVDQRAVSASRPFASASGMVRGLGCEDGGPLAIATSGGLLQLRSIESPFKRPALKLEAFSSADSSSLPIDEVPGMSIARGGRAFVTREGRRVAITGPDAVRIATMLRETPTAAANCVTATQTRLDRVDESAGNTLLKIGRCGSLELRVSGLNSRVLQIWRDGRSIATIPAGHRIGTYSLALSEDGRLLFVGGFLDGVLYDITDPAAPQQVAAIPATDKFSAASFAAGGTALILAETSPQGSYVNILVVPIDGMPLERAACLIGSGTLDATIATRLLNAERRRDLTCPGGHLATAG